MSQKTDLRIIKTRKNLYNTLETLMKESPFEEIKVNDICNKAMINRSTFYAHYTDKYELLQEYINSLKDNLLTKLDGNNNIKNTKEYYLELIKLLLEHFEEKKETYHYMMINNKNSITMDIIYDVINKGIIKQIEESTDFEGAKVPSSIISLFYLGAVINICIEYLKYNNKYTKEQIIEYINILIPDNLY